MKKNLASLQLDIKLTANSAPMRHFYVNPTVLVRDATRNRIRNSERREKRAEMPVP